MRYYRDQRAFSRAQAAYEDRMPDDDEECTDCDHLLDYYVAPEPVKPVSEHPLCPGCGVAVEDETHCHCGEGG